MHDFEIHDYLTSSQLRPHLFMYLKIILKGRQTGWCSGPISFTPKSAPHTQLRVRYSMVTWPSQSYAAPGGELVFALCLWTGVAVVVTACMRIIPDHSMVVGCVALPMAIFSYSLCNISILANLLSHIEVWRFWGIALSGNVLLMLLMRDASIVGLVGLTCILLLLPLTDAMPARSRRTIVLVAFIPALVWTSLNLASLLCGAFPIGDFYLFSTGDLHVSAAITCIHLLSTLTIVLARSVVSTVVSPQDYLFVRSRIDYVLVSDTMYKHRVCVEEALFHSAKVVKYIELVRPSSGRISPHRVGVSPSAVMLTNTSSALHTESHRSEAGN
jgi:hypothetical protein